MPNNAPALRSATDPQLDHYFGVWSILEDAIRGLVQRAGNHDLQSGIDLKSQSMAAHGRAGIMRSGNVAIIEIFGVMSKHGSFFGGASTIHIREMIRNAAEDSTIDGILLHVDSPGGQVAGNDDLAKDVAAAAMKKPVHAFIEDLGASAAYRIASQATKVFANETALVGAIGTYSVVVDSSAMAEQQGVTVHVVRAGEFKGTGTPGTAITEQQLAEYQRIINEMNEFFIQGVARGRRMDVAKVRNLADGRVHLAGQAVKLGLIDGVQSLEQTIAGLRGAPSPSTRSTTARATATARAQSSGNRSAHGGGWRGLMADKLAQGKTRKQAAREIAAEQRRQ